MKHGQSLSELTAKILIELEKYFKVDKPNLVLAHGDTTTCLSTGISSFYHQIPFFHVEAGLRTYRLDTPFPEEFNRQTIAPIARHHFAPTLNEKENLVRDGVQSSAITITGSTIHDAIQVIRSQTPDGHLLNDDSRPLVVVTLHRREASNSLSSTLEGLKSAALHRPDVLFVCPVHPNPSVQSAFKTCLTGISNIMLTEPMGYPQFISLLMRSSLVMTDSGGVQEEAAFLGKNTLLARSETERLDGLDSGLVHLVGLEPTSVRDSILRGLSNSKRSDVAESCTRHLTSASTIIADEVVRAIQ